MLAPVLASLAVVLPAALAASELEALRRGSKLSPHMRRDMRQRALFLFALSASAFVIVARVWPL